MYRRYTKDVNTRWRVTGRRVRTETTRDHNLSVYIYTSRQTEGMDTNGGVIFTRGDQ